MQKIQNKKLTIQYDVYVASKGWLFILLGILILRSELNLQITLFYMLHNF